MGMILFTKLDEGRWTQTGQHVVPQGHEVVQRGP